MEGKTTITVDNETWERLNIRRKPGDRFNDVIVKVLDENEDLRNRVDELEERLEQIDAEDG